MEVIMNKVATLSHDQYIGIAKGNLGRDIREILGISETKEIHIGDTVCAVGQPSKARDVFKYTQNNINIFYIVIAPIDDKMAMCYSIY